jgi:hypothetical protein
MGLSSAYPADDHGKLNRATIRLSEEGQSMGMAAVRETARSRQVGCRARRGRPGP